ncbi:hypothetical protein WBG78_04255 [Chryseolinea sp. T2]|uniref:hypothetical protein n=1 Tax=Chryseolinea sp. T2 TaxID=3129255 RepID=UPI0030776CA9
MINGSFGIGFDFKEDTSLDDVKRGLHRILTTMFGNYYDKDWSDNRMYLELTTRNVFFSNEDLTRMLFDVDVSELENNIFGEFNSSVILGFFLDDSAGGRGFSLYESGSGSKRFWINAELEAPINSGTALPEEDFINQCSVATDKDEEEQKVYTHTDFKHPIYGERGLIETVSRRVLLNRFMYDYEWQRYQGGIRLLETDDFPIQDLQLLFGE